MSNQLSENLFIGISGLIGVGKTTAGKTIATKLGYDFYEEEIDGEIEALRKMFYKDMPRWSFAFQVRMFNSRLRQHRKLILNIETKGAVQDRTLWDDPSFSLLLRDNGNMNEIEYSAYKDLFQTSQHLYMRPDIMFFLYCDDLNIIMDRIKNKRAREEESGITIEYLQQLQFQIDKQFLRMERLGIQCFKFEWSKPDFYINTILHLVEKQKEIKRKTCI